MNRRKMTLVALSWGLVAWTAAAETVKFDGETATVAEDLDPAMLLTPENWSDDGEVSSEKDYELDKNGYYCIGGGNVFNGKSLTFTAGTIVFNDTAQSFTFANDGLVFNGGALNSSSASGFGHRNAKDFTINGKIDIRANATFNPYRTTSKNTFTGPSFSASPAATLTIRGPSGVGSAAAGLIKHRHRFLGDMSQFYGTLQLGASTSCLGLALLCTDNFAGQVQVMGGYNMEAGVTYYGAGTFGPCATNESGAVTEYVGEVKVAKLSVGDNGNLTVAINPSDLASGCGRITVTDTLTAAGKVNFFLQVTYPKYCMEERVIPFLTAPLGSNIADIDFNFVRPTFNVLDEICELRVQTNEIDRTESYCYVVPKYSTHLRSEDYSKSSSVADNFQANWAWNYETDPRTTFDDETIYVASSTVVARGSESFGGKRLVLYSDAKILVYAAPGIREIDLYDTAYVDVNGNGNIRLNNVLGVYGTGNFIQQDGVKLSSNDITLSPTSVLKGDGALEFRGTTNTVVTIMGDASGFSGKLSVSRWKNTVVVNDEQYTTLRIDDAVRLGTPVDTTTFVSNALTLLNYSRLQVTNTTAMTYPCRGLTVRGNGGVDVSAGKSFAYAAPLTLGGRLVKEGAGVFALGGDLRVPVDGENAPVANQNIVEVREGFLSALSTDAFDGAAITFADGAGICVDVGSADADLNAKGLVDTRVAEPFATTGASGKIAVSLRATGETGVEDKAVAVCTVPTGSAFADPAKYVQTGALKAGDVRFASFTSQDNGDDTTTILMNCTGKRGILLLVH